jgi:hypothetical protein
MPVVSVTGGGPSHEQDRSNAVRPRAGAHRPSTGSKMPPPGSRSRRRSCCARDWIDPNAGRVSLRDYALAWLRERPGLSDRTREGYDDLLRLHVLPTLGGLPVNAIRESTVRRWRSDLLDSGVGAPPLRRRTESSEPSCTPRLTTNSSGATRAESRAPATTLPLNAPS